MDRQMSIEDIALRFEGLSEQQIAAFHAALADSVHTVANIKAIIGIIEAELPRLKKTVATAENLLATINAKQKQWQG
jgi:hypothetical protein